MHSKTEVRLVVAENFIQAIRDSGYKSLGSALAELIDNAFEAHASTVVIKIERKGTDGDSDVQVRVSDDGKGMDAWTLRRALQFGWSSRFNQRNSHGRYGMGLPNASLSHARRVEVLSSTDGEKIAGTYLDVDEIAAGGKTGIARPETLVWPDSAGAAPFRRGTEVTWTKCDRLLHRKLAPLINSLHKELSRLFRYQLWAKKRIVINGEDVSPTDPLFVMRSTGIGVATRYGPDLIYQIAPQRSSNGNTPSIIRVRFSRLPVTEWHTLSNEKKNAIGIAKNAGVSIVRAGREIDTGWFFMGEKRKENYDDWWRCEVHFEPDLDEWFGVTHTKQEIHPTERLLSVLSPDLERIARDLNSQVRRAFAAAKTAGKRRKSEARAEHADSLCEPPKTAIASGARCGDCVPRAGRGRIAGLKYRFLFQRLQSEYLYHPECSGTQVTVVLNEDHPFVRAFWPSGGTSGIGGEAQKVVELCLLAAARAEISLSGRAIDRQRIKEFRSTWSKFLTTFLN